MIVIFSNNKDEHALAVSQKLVKNHNQRPLILDLSKIHRSFIHGLYQKNSSPDFSIEFTKEKHLNLKDVTSFWWRRPQPLQLYPEIASDSHKEFALSEWSTALNGFWESTDVLWVNDILNDHRAEHKPYQLKIAQSVGLTIPDTLISNNPIAVKSFYEKYNGEIIFKPFLATEQEWRETRPLKKEFFKVIDSVKFAPVIFQEYVKDSQDLRITVVGDKVFAAQTNPNQKYEFDWRMTEISWQPHQLDSEVEASIMKLMRILGLEYGAIDMKLTPDGQYYFLEVNPAGQFLFTEVEAHLPISDALAEKLTTGNKTNY